ncbi:MAG: DNA ligase [Nocardioidaceae bacterium]|nr:DNA ligase [Nocardioidaceae bacterium]
MRPMLASKGSHVPTGSAWVHEVKWDGVRVLAEVADGRLRLWSRNENEITAAYPELRGLADLGRDVLLDGELVAFTDGVPRFSAIADRMHVRNVRRAQELSRVNPVTLLVFDLLRLDGEDVMGRPLSERRALLESLGVQGPSWQVPATYGDGRMLLDATEQQGLEGIVSKKLSSRYHPGRRTESWLKFPHRHTGSYVVGGWRLETDSDTRIGAVLVGAPTGEGLAYRGRVGSGIAGRTGQRLLEVLGPLAADASPFCDEVPKVDALGTTWVRPEVVVEVASLGLTPGLRLRQPSYLGTRADLAPADLEVRGG